MINRFTDRRKKSVVALAGISVLAIAMGLGLSRAHAAGQQARGRAPAGRGTRGRGMFTPHVMRPWTDNTGFVKIFNGRNLDNWKGDPKVWHVEDGAITAVSTAAHPTGTTNIWWTGGEPANFILKETIKEVGNGNGGIQFRSANKAPEPRPAGARGGRGGRFGGRNLTPAQQKAMQARMAQMRALMQKNRPWALMGYQEDMDTTGRYDGQLYEQGKNRGIIALPGEVMVAPPDGKAPYLVAHCATAAQIKTWIPDPQGWNHFEIIADGNTMIQMVNGHVISILSDFNPTKAEAKGLIGMEIEGTIKIQYKDIYLKNLPNLVSSN